jgi:hypothetical protein
LAELLLVEKITYLKAIEKHLMFIVYFYFILRSSCTNKLYRSCV